MDLTNRELNETSGLVCAHHHLYSALARGMPAPPRTPHTFREILELVWWRLDRAVDLEMLEWSAKLGALEACLLYPSPSPRDGLLSRMPSSA